MKQLIVLCNTLLRVCRSNYKLSLLELQYMKLPVVQLFSILQQRLRGLNRL